MPTIQVTGYQVTAVYCSDLERSRAFYVDQLGFETAGDMTPGLMLKAADVMLYLEPGRTPRATPPHTHPEIAPVFAADSILAAHAALQAAGVTMVGNLHHPSPTFAFFQIADPDGNTLEFAGEP